MAEFNTPQTKLEDYSEAKKLFWDKLYKANGVTLYSREALANKAHRWANVEHVYPMSWVVNFVGCGDRDLCRRYSDQFNQIEADLHNMYPARRTLNYERGSLSFGMVAGEERKYGEYDFEVDLQNRVIEPTLESRGNIARAMFYMADAYGMKIFKRQRRLLISWNEQDPPSKREIQRNQLIEQLQGNRNHFIDYPEDVSLL